MRTRLIALAATLSIVGLAAAPFANATAPSGGGGGGVSSGGGGGGGGRGGGGGFHGAGGGFHGGGHFAGGGFRAGGGYRGGGYGNSAGYGAHANFMAHGGYVSHGSRGYHFVGYQSAGLRSFGAVPRAGHAGRISLALGPRMGSAAAAVRVAHQSRVDHMGAHPGRSGHRGHPLMHPKRVYATLRPYPYQYTQYSQRLPQFCEPYYPANGKLPLNPCLTPVKAKAASLR